MEVAYVKAIGWALAFGLGFLAWVPGLVGGSLLDRFPDPPVHFIDVTMAGVIAVLLLVVPMVTWRNPTPAEAGLQVGAAAAAWFVVPASLVALTLGDGMLFAVIGGIGMAVAALGTTAGIGVALLRRRTVRHGPAWLCVAAAAMVALVGPSATGWTRFWYGTAAFFLVAAAVGFWRSRKPGTAAPVAPA